MSAKTITPMGFPRTMPNPVLSAALKWVRRGVGVVPVRPMLVADKKGKLSPIPWIRWQQDGPLRTEEDVWNFWRDHPDAQLAVLLDNGLVTVDVDLKKLPGGRAPEGFPVPFGTGYRETTKSGGMHYVFIVKEKLDPSKSSRIVQLADYVDVLAGGILVVAPTKFDNAKQGYELQEDSLPVFSTMPEALGRYAQWLPGVWKARWEVSRTSTAPEDTRKQVVETPAVGPAVRASPPRAPGLVGAEAWAVDLDEMERAVAFVKSDKDALRFYTKGFIAPDGTVDHSKTEWMLTAKLKDEGFSAAASWAVVRMCRHTKSPYDRRGRRYFEVQVWGKLRKTASSQTK